MNERTSASPDRIWFECPGCPVLASFLVLVIWHPLHRPERSTLRRRHLISRSAGGRSGTQATSAAASAVLGDQPAFEDAAGALQMRYVNHFLSYGRHTAFLLMGVEGFEFPRLGNLFGEGEWLR